MFTEPKVTTKVNNLTLMINTVSVSLPRNVLSSEERGKTAEVLCV